MLHYAVVFFVIAIVAAIFGFGGIATASVGIAQVIFVIAIISFLVSLVLNGRRKSIL